MRPVGCVSVCGVILLNEREPSLALLRQAATGDQEAFARLTRRMMPLIHTQIRRLHGAALEEDDLLQEALLGLLAAVRSYRPEAGALFTTYATTCIRHRLVSAARRSAPRTQREQPLDADTPLTDRRHDPALHLQEQEDAIQLQQRLRRRLTPLEYQVLLARLQNRSYQEIADRLGVGKKTVDNAVQRLRRKLSSAL